MSMVEVHSRDRIKMRAHVGQEEIASAHVAHHHRPQKLLLLVSRHLNTTIYLGQTKKRTNIHLAHSLQQNSHKSSAIPILQQ